MHINNARKAYEVASQWGSYMHAGDPGAAFYGFHPNDGRPQDERHRGACLAYCQHLICDTNPEDADLAQLVALRIWFASCEVRSNG